LRFSRILKLHWELGLGTRGRDIEKINFLKTGPRNWKKSQVGSGAHFAQVRPQIIKEIRIF
jgi:hypothetical protein